MAVVVITAAENAAANQARVPMVGGPVRVNRAGEPAEDPHPPVESQALRHALVRSLPRGLASIQPSLTAVSCHTKYSAVHERRAFFGRNCMGCTSLHSFSNLCFSALFVPICSNSCCRPRERSTPGSRSHTTSRSVRLERFHAAPAVTKRR